MNVRSEQDGRVRRLTLASPGTRNVMNAAMAGDLLWELDSTDTDNETGAVLLDAEGDVFCGGMEEEAVLPEEFYTFGRRAAKPVVVAMRGVAISAGVALLANAHVVLAAQGSSFGLTDLREGRCHTMVLAAVAEALGDRRTRELALTGRIFTVPDAMAWGLVHAALPPFELEDRAMAVARGLAGANQEAVRLLLGHFGGCI